MGVTTTPVAPIVLRSGCPVGWRVVHRPRHGCREGGHQHASQDTDQYRPAEAEVGESHEGAAGETERAGETADRRGGQEPSGGPLEAVEHAVQHVSQEQETRNRTAPAAPTIQNASNAALLCGLPNRGCHGPGAARPVPAELLLRWRAGVELPAFGPRVRHGRKGSTGTLAPRDN